MSTSYPHQKKTVSPVAAARKLQDGQSNPPSAVPGFESRFKGTLQQSNKIMDRKP
jgi:hypothetical protein